MISYQEPNALPPTAFCAPARFVTDFDTINPDHAAEQYAKGLQISRDAGLVSITCASTWAAKMADGVMTSCEGIGYHANTADLLRGFLDGPAPVVVHRYGTADGVEIKPRTPGKTREQDRLAEQEAAR